jgi:hypothetical protein
MLLTNVAKIDMVTTQPGMMLSPRVNDEDVLFFLKNDPPKIAIPTI